MAMRLAALVAAAWILKFTEGLKVSTRKPATFDDAFKALVGMPKDQIEQYYASLKVMGKEHLDKQDEGAVAAWYNVVSKYCDLGDYEKMYIPPVLDPHAGFTENQRLFETGMADALEASEGKVFLDLGCGKGRIAHEVANHSHCKVVGMNLEVSQLENAKRFAAAKGMLHSQLEFQQGSFNDPLPFANETFDGAYEIGAFSYAVDLPELASEIYRVLKPGARFSYNDWIRLNYDPSNPEHVEILRQVKPLTGMVSMPFPSEVEDAFKSAGFEVEFSGDASVGGLTVDLFMKDASFGSLSKIMMAGVLAPETLTFFKTAGPGGRALIEAMNRKLLSVSYQIIVKKPKST